MNLAAKVHEFDNCELRILIMPWSELKLSEFILVITIGILGTLVMIFSPDANELLRYQYQQVNEGQFWRILTANICHSNWNHWLLNLSGLVLIDYLNQPFLSQAKRSLILLICMIGSVLPLHWWLQLEWYVGLSGALHGYLLAGALITWSQAKWSNSAIVIIVIGKLILELNWEINSTTAQLINANVVEEAHLAGAITGIFCFVLLWLKRLIIKKAP